jgi:hypothetical protein
MYRSAAITRSYMRALSPWLFCMTITVTFLPALSARARESGEKWVATWATAPATFFVYTPPVPPVFPPGAPTTFAPANIQPDQGFPFPDADNNQALNQTFRTIVKPDLWGSKMRFRFSNAFGSQPVTFSSVTVGLQEYSGNVVEHTLDRVVEAGFRPNGPREFSPGFTLGNAFKRDEP